MLFLCFYSFSNAQNPPQNCVEFYFNYNSGLVPPTSTSAFSSYTNNTIETTCPFDVEFWLAGTFADVVNCSNVLSLTNAYALLIRSSNLSASLPVPTQLTANLQPVIPNSPDWNIVGFYPIILVAPPGPPPVIIPINHSDMMQYRVIFVTIPPGSNQYHMVPSSQIPYSNPIFARVSPLEVNIGAPLTVCSNTPVTLTAPAGLTNYQWAASPTFGSSGPSFTNTQSITFTPFNVGVNSYQFTASDANGCLYKGTRVVTTLPNVIPTLIVGNTTRCSPIYNYSIGNPNANATYSWNLPGGTLSNTTGLSTSIVNLPPGTGSFNLIVSTTLNGCTRLDTLLIGSCCSEGHFYVITNKALTDIFPPSTTIFPNSVVLINGMLALDINNFTFNGTHIYLGPNARIEDIPGIKTNFINCTFEHCPNGTEMWDGIYTTGINNEINFTNCTLTASINGLVSTDAAKLKVIGSNFENNHMAIQIKNSNPISFPNVGSSQRFIIEGNTFDTDASMNTDFSNGIGPFAYIYTNLSTNVLIGKNGINNLNNFQTKNTSKHYGVYGLISSLEINNANFEYLGGIGQSLYQGIYSSTVGKTGPFFQMPTNLYVAFNNSNATFTNLNTGVWSHSNDVTFVYSSRMNYIKNVGVRVTNSRNFSSVKFCEMELQSNNYIGEYGILMEHTNPLLSSSTVFNNAIRQKRIGIFLMNINASAIQNNVLSYTDLVSPSGPTQIGIYSSSCKNLVVEKNEIRRTIAPLINNYLSQGIVMIGGLGNTVKENLITNMSTGINSSGSLTGTRYQCNTYNNLIHGMQFSNATLTNQGTPDLTFDNIWNNNRTSIKINGSGNPTNNIQWYHRASAPYNISGVQIQDFSLNNQLGAMLANINAASVCPSLDPPGPGPGTIGPLHEEALLEKIVEGETNEYNVELQKDDFHFAYQKLDQDSVLRFSNSDLEQFYLNKTTENEGIFREITKLAEIDQVIDAIVSLENYQPITLRESIMKQATTHYLHSWQSGKPLDSVQRADLLNIASLDPTVFGDGVIVAQVLLGYYPIAVEHAFKPSAKEIVQEKPWNPSIFPNPAHNYLTVTDIEGEYNYIITNLQGKVMQRGKLAETSSININQLNHGMYLLKLIQGDKTSTLKVVKQ